MKKLFFCFLMMYVYLIGQQIVQNPDFTERNDKGSLTGWNGAGNLKTEWGTDGQPFVTLKAGSGIGQNLVMKPEYGSLRLKFQMKTDALEIGDQEWKTGRLAMSFVDAEGKQVGGWPPVFGFTGTNDWKDCERVYQVPKGAVKLVFSCSHFGKTGTVSFRHVTFTVEKLRALAPANAPCPIDDYAAQSLDDAWKQETPTRATYSLNGLWQARPVVDDSTALPAENDCWGWYKIPHVWTDNWLSPEANQKPVVAQWLTENYLEAIKNVTQVWFKRRIVIPANWADKDVALDFTMVNSYVQAYIDGVAVGELFFPGGEIAIGKYLKPGKEQEIALLVKAIPLNANEKTFMAPDRIIEKKATVKAKGLCGDVYLHVRPATQHVDFVTVVTSVEHGTITFKTEMSEADNRDYVVTAKVTLPDKRVKTFTSQPLKLDKAKTLSFTSPWTDAPLWDTDSPQLLTANVSVHSAGTLLDTTTPVTFGFREFMSRGKDMFLNGKRIHLRALHCEIGTTPMACYNTVEAAKETIRRCREYGFNHLITAHYSIIPGAISYLDGLLEATQQTGMLLSYSLSVMPNFAWKIEDPKVREDMEKTVRFLMRKAVNNPSVIMYAMNHNSTGYYGDQNPLKIDGLYQYEPPETDWQDLSQTGTYSRRVKAKALETMVKRMDPTRLVYHHESGNLGDLHTINIYLNWAPKQERSDWMAHWHDHGVKPVFFVEWGVPHVSSWSSHRGPSFIWRTPEFQSIWAAEFAAAEYGGEAYRQAAEYGARAIDHEERLWATGKPFSWGYLNIPLRDYPFYHQLMSDYTKDNWRAHRTYGVSAMLPWDQGELWGPPKSKLPSRYVNDLTKLKHPGISPDFIANDKNMYMYDLNGTGHQPTEVGKAFLRWNMPTCAYIGGPRERFTEKSHIFRPGESFDKSIVAINDTRHEQSVTAVVTFDGKTQTLTGTVAPGDVLFLPCRFTAPEMKQFSVCNIEAKVTFGNGDVNTDVFEIQVLPKNNMTDFAFQLYDPKGLTRQMLKQLGYTKITELAASSQPDFNQMIVIGREALTDAPSLPWLATAVEHGTVIVFEQTQDVLAHRLGFRTNIHGLRKLFPTDAGELLTNISGFDANAQLDKQEETHHLIGYKELVQLLSDWRGDSTLTKPHLDLPQRETTNPTWNWHGFTNTRVWRCGNRGNVADVLIEKPTVGDWLPFMVGGFDLQYSPLLLHRSYEGFTLFCQLDVTGRTEPDPAAENTVIAMMETMHIMPLTVNPKDGASWGTSLMTYHNSWTGRNVVYAGGQKGRTMLENLGIEFADYAHQPLFYTLIVMDSDTTVETATAIAATLKEKKWSVNLLLLAVKPEVYNVLFNRDDVREATALYAQPLPCKGCGHLTDGLTDADVYWHTKLTFNPVAESENASLGIHLFEDGSELVVLQAPPWLFDIKAKPYLRTTQRRALFTASRLLSNLGAKRRTGTLPFMMANPPVAMGKLQLTEGWRGTTDSSKEGRKANWYADAYNASNWKPIQVGTTWERQFPELEQYNGWFWYRLEFDTPSFPSDESPVLSLGACDDESWVWLNGTFLGEITKETNPNDYWQAERAYTLPDGLLKKDGKNVLTVLINDTYLHGGIVGRPHFKYTGRWLKSYYLQIPEKNDDPYRYYRW